MANSELIVFNGHRFRRYPDAAQWSDKTYFCPGIGDRQNGVKRLHEEIWIYHNGPIPAGHHVHHADGDPLNNDPDNLECISAEDHRDHHAEHRRGRPTTQEHLEHLARIRPAAAEWHRSEEGREWHRQHGRDVWKNRTRVNLTCEVCGAEFDTLTPHQTRFCSNNCKSTARRRSGVDNEVRACAHCGDEFTVNKYAATKCCGKTCAQRLRALE